MRPPPLGAPGAIRWFDALPAHFTGAAALVTLDHAGRDLPPADDEDRAAAERRPATERPGFLRRRALLRAFVGRVLGVPPEAVAVAAGPDGVPRLLTPTAALHLSLSHRQNYVAAAVGPSRIGVDLEIMGEPAEPAWNILADSERDALMTLPEMTRWGAFLRIWTAKEAYLKALGTGLWREPRDIEVTGLQKATFGIVDRTMRVDPEAAEHRMVAIGDIDLLVACVLLPGE